MREYGTRRARGPAVAERSSFELGVLRRCGFGFGADASSRRKRSSRKRGATAVSTSVGFEWSKAAIATPSVARTRSIVTLSGAKSRLVEAVAAREAQHRREQEVVQRHEGRLLRGRGRDRTALWVKSSVKQGYEASLRVAILTEAIQ
jgi:hypothetical protein